MNHPHTTSQHTGILTLAAIGFLCTTPLQSAYADYRLRVACDIPGYIKVSLTGPGIDGALEEEFDLHLQLPVYSGGNAGFYISAARSNVAFDDLVIRTGESTKP